MAHLSSNKAKTFKSCPGVSLKHALVSFWPVGPSHMVAAIPTRLAKASKRLADYFGGTYKWIHKWTHRCISTIFPSVLQFPLVPFGSAAQRGLLFAPLALVFYFQLVVTIKNNSKIDSFLKSFSICGFVGP